MDRGQRPEQEGKKDTFEKWDYEKMVGKCSRLGFLAAYPVGVYTHRLGNTKPCRRRFTQGVMDCGICQNGDLPVWKGYTMYYSAEFENRFVLISQPILEYVESIPLFSHIEIFREGAGKSPIRIRETVKVLRALPLTAKRQGEQNIMSFLLFMWKDAELSRWYAANTPSLPLSSRPHLEDPDIDELLKATGERLKLQELQNAHDSSSKKKKEPKFLHDGDYAYRKNGKHEG